MEEEPQQTDATEHSEDSALESDELAPTPLDHPLFLPVLFLGLAIWFGYDAYFTSEDMLEHLDFNRYGFRLLVFLGLLYGYRGACEMKDVPSHPLVVPGLLLLSTGWLAYDAWLSSDAHNLSRAGVNRALIPWLVGLTSWYGVTGWLRMQGKQEPAFVLPMLILGCSAWFGYNAYFDPQATPTDVTLNRWAAVAIFAGFLLSVYSAFRRPPLPAPALEDDSPPAA